MNRKELKIACLKAFGVSALAGALGFGSNMMAGAELAKQGGYLLHVLIGGATAAFYAYLFGRNKTK
jgi:hypothetical protein